MQKFGPVDGLAAHRNRPRTRAPFVYLGYWIRDSKKMAYKTEYRPIEMLINSKWIRTN